MARDGNRKSSANGNRWKISEEDDGPDYDDVHDEMSEHSTNSEDSQGGNENDEQPARTRGPNKGADVPENDADRPTIIAIGNQFPDSRVTSDITQIIRSNYSGFWPTWKEVPDDKKGLFWKQFSMHYKWPAWRHSEFYNAWKKTNSDRFRNMMSDERIKAKAKYGENKIAWKKYKSEWIGKRHWIRLIDEKWNTPEWESKSGSAKKNRLQGNETADPTYCGGSIPMCAHKELLAIELKREPTELEIFDKTHKTENGKGDFVSQNAKHVRENYEKIMEEKFPDVETRPSFDPVVWSEACGGTSKNRRLYRFGSRQYEQGGTSFDRDESDKKIVELEKIIQDMQQKHIESLRKLEASIPDITRRTMLQIANESGSEDVDESGDSDYDGFDMDMHMEHKRKRVYAGRYEKGVKNRVERSHKKKRKTLNKTLKEN
ncbi:hypothetical protein OROMI_032132 [Orobanche minor]